MNTRYLYKFTLLVMLVFGLAACNNIRTKTELPKINNLQNRTVTPALPTQTLTPHPITIGKGELMVVVAAVEKYYDDHGVYPESITDLIPGYIAQFPYTFDGHEIWYERNEYQTYKVGFDPSERKYCVYLKDDNYLECGFRNPELFITWVLPTSTTVPPHAATLSPRQQSIQEMLFVVDAVEKYQADYGFYPESIDNLMPFYLAKLPFTNEGFEITYRLHEKYVYEVSFWPATNRYCSFVKRDDYWECGFYVEH